MISFSQVTKRYPGGHEALRNVAFTVNAGEMAFVTGHSGAGKSTLLKLVAAIERPTSGSVIVNGQNVGAMKSGAIPYLRCNLGLVFQDQKLLFDLLNSVVQATGSAEPVRHPLAASGEKVDGGANVTTVSKELREWFAKAFANPPREPEVDHHPALKAALFLMNDSEVLGRLRSQPGNLVNRLIQLDDGKQLAEELYLTVLSRLPTDEETADVATYWQAHVDRPEIAAGHLAWSLLASTEFFVNH